MSRFASAVSMLSVSMSRFTTVLVRSVSSMCTVPVNFLKAPWAVDTMACFTLKPILLWATSKS